MLLERVKEIDLKMAIFASIEGPETEGEEPEKGQNEKERRKRPILFVYSTGIR